MVRSKSRLPVPPSLGSLSCDLAAPSMRKALGSGGTSSFTALAPCGLRLSVFALRVISWRTGGVSFGEELIEDVLCGFYRVGHAHRLAWAGRDARESSGAATQLYITTRRKFRLTNYA